MWRIAKYIKKMYENIVLLLGGSHISINPDKKYFEGFDVICVGEGEYPVFELVSSLKKRKPPTQISNLWIKQGSKVEKNPTRKFIQDLDSLPFPNRKMWQEIISVRKESRISILLGRGCPFQCSYCCNRLLKKVAPGHYVRMRSPENIMHEIKYTSNLFPKINDIYLEVETFGLQNEWSEKLCHEIEKYNRTLDTPLSFGTNLRAMPGLNYKWLFENLQKANFNFINIGLESGNEKLRKAVLKRNYSNDDILNTVKTAREYSINVCLYNMIGIPVESKRDFLDTVEMNRKCQPDKHYPSIFYPYPGTALRELCEKSGFINTKSDFRMERFRSVLDLPEFSKKQIQKCYVWFDYLIYKGLKPAYRLLLMVLRAKLRSSYYLNYI